MTDEDVLRRAEESGLRRKMERDLERDDAFRQLRGALDDLGRAILEWWRDARKALAGRR